MTRTHESRRPRRGPVRACSPVARPIKPNGLPYPRTKSKTSSKKQLANDLVVDMFEAQGLGKRVRDATIVILDTQDLRTTLTLLHRHKKSIRQIIIVEINFDTCHEIKDAVARMALDSIVTVICSDVIDFLALVRTRRPDMRIDYVWIDAMAAYIPAEHKAPSESVLPKAVAALATRCLAITFSNRMRAGDTHRARVGRLTNLFRGVLPYVVLDWGYKLATTTQSMQLVAFGAVRTGCLYSVREVSPVPDDPSKAFVGWYGYPGEWTLEPGSPSSW